MTGHNPEAVNFIECALSTTPPNPIKSIKDRIFIIMAFLLTSACMAGTNNSPHTIVVVGGQCLSSETHNIIISPNASAPELHAATQLRDWLTSVTGESIPLVREGDSHTTRIPILVGRSNLSDQLAPDIPYERLGTDGICMMTVGPSLILTGGKRGVLYAVYSFLDECVGIKWLAPDCTVIPGKALVRVPHLNKVYVPRLATRALDYFSAFDQDWAVRNKVNGYGYAKQGSIDEMHGGEVLYPGPQYFWSTLRVWIPIDKYREKHPEYFSEIDGKRVTSSEFDTDYCLTNPDVFRLTLEGVLRTLRENPKSNMISVSQNDHVDRYCRCTTCSELTAKHGGRPSALVVDFVNRIADAISTEFPDVKITTLAYHWSQNPPTGMRVHRNVIIEFCPITMSQRQPLFDTPSPLAATLRKYAAEWTKICPPGNFKFCNYSINYAHLYLPHPNLNVFEPNLRYFVNLGAGHYYDCGSYSNRGSEFAELRAYLIAKLAWEPDAETQPLINEFLEGYYGDAAPYVREYIHILHVYAARNAKPWFVCYASPTDGQYSLELLDKADRLFDKAESAVSLDPVLLKRVRIARLPLMYGRVMLSALTVRQNDGMLLSDLSSQTGNINKFTAALSEMKVKSVADIEIKSPDSWKASMLDAARQFPYHIITLKNPLIEVLVTPQDWGRIWKIRDLAKGRELLGTWGGGEDSLSGRRGYEEFTNRQASAGGAYEGRFSVTEATSRTLAMRAVLSNGLLCTRTLTLAPKNAVISMTTMLENPTTRPIEISPVTHPSFNVSKIKMTHVEVWRDGRLVSQKKLTTKNAKQTFWFKPTGKWTLADTVAETAITETYDPGRVDQCLVWTDPGRSLDTCSMELRLKNETLAPGAKWEFTHTYTLSRLPKPSISERDNAAEVAALAGCRVR